MSAETTAATEPAAETQQDRLHSNQHIITYGNEREPLITVHVQDDGEIVVAAHGIGVHASIRVPAHCVDAFRGAVSTPYSGGAE